MIVVGDSSALITLSVIGQLHLLENLYGGVFIPHAVYDEVVVQGAGRAGVSEVRDADFIWVEELGSSDQVALYTDEVSPQDAAVIVLAKEKGADFIITRDRGLQRTARREGISIMNVRVLLLAAKREGLITAVKPLLDEMRNRGILMREGIYQETLRQAGEADNSHTSQDAS
ncbi:DUF3368 domain-containing protein [Candidatus Poribacteria bacterium]|nr:DUF3368 domain-containing protein [Candidatus Poribacteria bacterium]